MLTFSPEFHTIPGTLQAFTKYTLRKIDYSVFKTLNGEQYTPVTCSNFFQGLPFFALGFSYKSLNWD